MTMQWIAILAALGWCLLQVILLLISSQCIFLMIEFRSDNEHKLYQKLLSNFIKYLFYSLFILPLISLGLFIYGVINIKEWCELKLGLWVFAAWWVALFVLSYALSMKKNIVFKRVLISTAKKFITSKNSLLISYIVNHENNNPTLESTLYLLSPYTFAGFICISSPGLSIGLNPYCA